MPADDLGDLAPLGTRSSADTLMINFRAYISTQHTFCIHCCTVISPALLGGNPSADTMKSNFRFSTCTNSTYCNHCCIVNGPVPLNHWGWVTHICVSKLSILGSDKGLSPGRRQAIIWTNTGILLIEPFGTNFSEILIEINTFSFKKLHLKMSSGKWRPFCLCLNVLTTRWSAGISMVLQGAPVKVMTYSGSCIQVWPAFEVEIINP